MSLPIKSTPTLNAKESKTFLKELHKNEEKKAEFTPTPKIKEAEKLIKANGREWKKSYKL